METIRFASDTRTRKRLMTGASGQHPAKGHLGLWEMIIQKYTKTGDTVLDPMAGVGSTLLAAIMGRNVILVELAGWMLPLLRANWGEMRQHPMLGCELGQVTILQGDARNLEEILADCIITSPPYEGSIESDESFRKQVESGYWRPIREGRKPDDPFIGGEKPYSGYTRPSAIVTSPPFEDQISAQDKTWLAKHAHEITSGGKAGVQFGPAMQGSYTCPSAIITSPPYEASATSSGLGSVNKDDWGKEGTDIAKRRGLQVGYTRPVAIISSPPFQGQNIDQRTERPGREGRCSALGGSYTPLSAIIFSPPYEDSINDNQEGPGQTSVPGGWKAGTVDKHGGYTRPSAIVTSPPYENSELPREEHDDTREDGIHPRHRYIRPEAIISSPPFGEAQTGGGIAQEGYVLQGGAHTGAPDMIGNRSYMPRNQGKDDAQIGNMRGEKYWVAMSAVYEGCFNILKPGSIMALVLKGFTRGGEYVDLPSQTLELCESLGFVAHDRWRRELYSLSFWRILEATDKVETVVAHRKGMFDLDVEEVKTLKRVNNGKLDERLRYEEVVVVRKPE